MTVGIHFDCEENNEDIFIFRSESFTSFLSAGNILSQSFFVFSISFCTRKASICANLSARFAHPLRMISTYSQFLRFGASGVSARAALNTLLKDAIQLFLRSRRFSPRKNRSKTQHLSGVRLTILNALEALTGLTGVTYRC